jgi:hypothetical protein
MFSAAEIGNVLNLAKGYIYTKGIGRMNKLKSLSEMISGDEADI